MAEHVPSFPIYWEKQESALCGTHAVNNLLQGPYYSEVDMASIAHSIDERERALMMQAGTDSADYLSFMVSSTSSQLRADARESCLCSCFGVGLTVFLVCLSLCVPLPASSSFVRSGAGQLQRGRERQLLHQRHQGVPGKLWTGVRQHSGARVQAHQGGAAGTDGVYLQPQRALDGAQANQWNVVRSTKALRQL